MTRVYWDSMLFIYMLEANPAFGPRVRTILNQIVTRGDTLSTSVFTLGEILTGPRRRGSLSGIEAVKKYFSAALSISCHSLKKQPIATASFAQPTG